MRREEGGAYATYHSLEQVVYIYNTKITKTSLWLCTHHIVNKACSLNTKGLDCLEYIHVRRKRTWPPYKVKLSYNVSLMRLYGRHNVIHTKSVSIYIRHHIPYQEERVWTPLCNSLQGLAPWTWAPNETFQTWLLLLLHLTSISDSFPKGVTEAEVMCSKHSCVKSNWDTMLVPTSPSSWSWVSMTIAADLCSHTILQKSPIVFSIGPWVMMKVFLWR